MPSVCLLAFALLLGLLLPPATATTPILTDPPMPTDEPRPTHTGFDWSQRPNHTKVELIRSPTATVDLSSMTTPYLDIVLDGVPPSTRLTLTQGEETFANPSTTNGRVYFWNVPNAPGRWTLHIEDVTDMVIDLVGNPAVPLSWPCAFWDYTCKSGPAAGARTPKPVSADKELVLHAEQLAISFTTDAIVSTSTTWRHTSRVQAYISGGEAAGSQVGGDFSSTETTTISFQSQGVPAKLSRYGDFQRDKYADGSYKIYQTGAHRAYDLRPVDAYYEPRGSENITLQPGVGGVAVERSETQAGGVYAKGVWGAKAFGIDIGVTFWSTGEVETKVRIDMAHPDMSQLVEYRWNFVNGAAADSTGIVGEVWRVR